MLACLVRLLHLYIVCFMIVVPFQDAVNLMILHVVSGLSILTHWWANDNTCFLSLVESRLRGIRESKGFIHSIVAPVYELNQRQSCLLSYGVLLALMIISVYRIVTSEKWSEAWKRYEKEGVKAFLIMLKK